MGLRRKWVAGSPSSTVVVWKARAGDQHPLGTLTVTGYIVPQLRQMGQWRLVGSFSNMATQGVTCRATAAQTVAPTKRLRTSAWVVEGPAGRAAPESPRDPEHMP